MTRCRCAWTVRCAMLLPALAAPVQAEALRPSAAKRVEQNSAAVIAELRDVIAAGTTPEGERLASLVDDESSRWGIRHRDGYLLFSIPVRENLTLRDKADGEREAKDLALVTLGQKFNRMLGLEDASQGLDPDAVRVILIEPDAELAFTVGLGARGYRTGNAGAARRGWQHQSGPFVSEAAPCSCQ